MNPHLNLLPWSCQRRTVYRECLFSWCAILTIQVAFVGVWLTSEYSELSQLRLKLTSAESSNRPLRNLDDLNGEMRSRLKLSDERQILLEQLDAPQRPLLLMAVVSDCSKLTKGGIQIRSFVSSQKQKRSTSSTPRRSRGKRVEPKPDDQPEQEETLLSLEGIAGDDITLARFMTGLRATGIFETVELLSSSDVPLLTGSARQFSVECKL